MDTVGLESRATRRAVMPISPATAVVIIGLLAGCATAEEEGRRGIIGSSAAGASGGGVGVAGDGAGEGGVGAAGDGASGATVVGGVGIAGDGAGGDRGGGAGGPAGAGGAGGAGGTDAPPTIACHPIVEGISTVSVSGASRSFLVDLPSDTSNMALLFVWHGFAQDPATFAREVVYDVPAAKWVPFDPNAFPMPLLIVTPVDIGLLPPAGLDWDIAAGTQDFPFFDGMLQCIQEQFRVDENRIYSFGFSAGAVFTNLLSAEYPDLFAATISESGAWFNDPAQHSDVLVPLMKWDWPDFDGADGGNVLMTHGGTKDFATVISLESANKKARPFLLEHGRTVVDCLHTFGHTLDPDLTQTMYYDYMWSHQRGGPPLSNMPPGFPTQASPVGATSCTFHTP